MFTRGVVEKSVLRIEKRRFMSFRPISLSCYPSTHSGLSPNSNVAPQYYYYYYLYSYTKYTTRTDNTKIDGTVQQILKIKGE